MGAKVTKNDIIKALLNESFFRSMGATSMSDIAGRLSIKKASLYNHFASRDELVKRTMESCAEYISSVTFTPIDIAAVVSKYPPETVLKGIVKRYFKIHEKAPLFQIYTFIQSQKYFSKDAMDIVIEEHAKLLNQTTQLLEAFDEQGKILLPKERIPGVASWLCTALQEYLNRYLIKRKLVVIRNPDSGEGQLFSLPEDDQEIEQMFVHIDDFTRFLK